MQPSRIALLALLSIIFGCSSDTPEEKKDGGPDGPAVADGPSGDGPPADSASDSALDSDRPHLDQAAVIDQEPADAGPQADTLPPDSGLLPDCTLTSVRCVGPGKEYAVGQLQQAIDDAVAGDTVLLFPATYYLSGDGSSVQFPKSGTSNDRIVVRGVDRDAVIIDGTGMYGHTQFTDHDSRDGLLLESRSYISLESFTVRKAPRSGIFVGSSDHVTIRNVRTHNNGKQFGAVDCYCWGILTGFSEHLLIEGNVVHNNGQHGIYVGNSADYPVIRGNVCYGNLTSGIQVNGDCYAGGDGSITGAIIEKNVLYDNKSKPLSIISMSGSVIRNNLIYSNGAASGAAGIHLTDEPGCGKPSNDNLVVNNTIVEPLRAGIRLTDNVSGNVIFNNILVSPKPIGSEPENSQNHIDALSNIKQTTAAGLFVSATNDDYHLSSTSPARNPTSDPKSLSTYQGKSAPAKDIEGNPRPMGGAHDIGAYEYVE